MNRSTPEQVQPAEAGRPTWHYWVIGIVAALVIVFIVQNAQKVEVDFIFSSTETPLIFALLITTVLGFALGWLVARLQSRRRD